MSGYVQPKAAWKVTLDGRDLTDTLAPLLISMRLTEKRGEEADELTIVINDGAGNVAIPPEGAKLRVQLGWERGTGVKVGMVDKGSFIVDEVSWSGPPDQMKGNFRTRKNKVWHNAPLGTVVQEIAAHHSLTPRCHADLASKVITAEQGNKSDMQFLRDIGRRFDATATVKAAMLIFAPIGSDTTATGKPMPTGTIDRRNTSSVTWKRAARDTIRRSLVLPAESTYRMKPAQLELPSRVTLAIVSSTSGAEKTAQSGRGGSTAIPATARETSVKPIILPPFEKYEQGLFLCDRSCPD